MPSENQQQYYRAVQQAQRQQRPERQWFWVGRDDAGMGLIQDAGGNIIPAFVAGNAAIAPGMPVLYVPPQPWQQYGQVQLATVVTPQPVRPPERRIPGLPIKFIFKEPGNPEIANIYWVCGPFEPIRVEFPPYSGAFDGQSYAQIFWAGSLGKNPNDWFIMVRAITPLDPPGSEEGRSKQQVFWKRGSDEVVTEIETLATSQNTVPISGRTLTPLNNGYYFERDFTAQAGSLMTVTRFDIEGSTREISSFYVNNPTQTGNLYGYYNETDIAPDLFECINQDSTARYSYGQFQTGEEDVIPVIYDRQTQIIKNIPNVAIDQSMDWTDRKVYSDIGATQFEDGAFIDAVLTERELTEGVSEWTASAPIQKQGQEIILPPQYDFETVIFSRFSYHP